MSQHAWMDVHRSTALHVFALPKCTNGCILKASLLGYLKDVWPHRLFMMVDVHAGTRHLIVMAGIIAVLAMHVLDAMHIPHVPSSGHR